MPQSTKKQHGYLSIVLHAHLPYVRHPEYNYVQEENWLFEAITETYLPLLDIFENLSCNRIPFKITMSITPPLCTMLCDNLLQERYLSHLSRLIDLAEKETIRLKNDSAFLHTTEMYLQKFRIFHHIFDTVCQGNIVQAFRNLQDKGNLEIITCGATHGYLPNMQQNPKAVEAQIQVAVQSYENFFGRMPQGIWLPECGYYHGLENILDKAGLRFFFTDTHGILFAKPRPINGVYAPVYCKDTQVAAFGRDIESSKSVWSSKVGYPGDSDYREFYRDIGFDLDFDYISPYIDPIGQRLNTGIKYHRITGDTDNKEPYSYIQAKNKAFEHAENFLKNRLDQIEYLSTVMDRPPIIVAPYDAELFGHWWYEGPNWLNFLIRKIAFDQDTITLVSPSDYLNIHSKNQVCEPSFSSWGQNGYSEVWLDSSNDWIYRHLHIIETRMTELAQTHKETSGLLERTLNQMSRELLLAESSDWAFIMKTGTMVEYAVRRTREHIANFQRLSDEIDKNSITESFVSLLESHNNIFPNIDYRVYR